jgi:release factor glutamine methyltransferase
MIFKDLVFDVFPGVYRPCDDSFLLAEHLEVMPGQKVLDMGTGCGIQGVIAARGGASVLACDVSQRAVECARHNAAKNRVGMEVVRSDLFEEVEGTFDLIPFNPPYLPSDPMETLERETSSRGDIESLAWDGGRSGREVISRFISRCKDFLEPGGRVLLVASSLSGIKEIKGEFMEAGFIPKIIDRRRFFFEEMVLIEGCSSGTSPLS